MIDVARHAFMITGFVFVMMLLIEYLNVLTSGEWQKGLSTHKWGQYLLAAVLGATPGCLGAFAVVAMYSHRVLTLGAVVTAMIATSGDESFVMLAMIPKTALLLTAILFVLSIVSGVLTDVFVGKHSISKIACSDGFEFHREEHCDCFPRGRILHQWKKCTASRGILTVVLSVFVIALIAGQIGPPAWNWVNVTLLIVSLVGIFIVSTVPDHFLEEHLWQHVARKHVPRVFLWIFGTLICIYILQEHLAVDLKSIVHKGKWVVLLAACLIGIIPESGPHMLFLTLYVQGTIPFSILMASSIVQDGHGMLPLLAHSRHAFFAIKAVNVAVGLLFGGLALAAGF